MNEVTTTLTRAEMLTTGCLRNRFLRVFFWGIWMADTEDFFRGRLVDRGANNRVIGEKYSSYDG